MDAKKQLEYNKNRERKEPYRSFILADKQQIHFSMYGTEIYDGLIHGVIYLTPQSPYKISQIQILNKSFSHKITLPQLILETYQYPTLEVQLILDEILDRAETFLGYYIQPVEVQESRFYECEVCGAKHHDLYDELKQNYYHYIQRFNDY